MDLCVTWRIVYKISFVWTLMLTPTGRRGGGDHPWGGTRRGAVGTEGLESEEGVSPSSVGRSLGSGVPSPQKKLHFWLWNDDIFVYSDPIFEAWIDTVTPFSPSLYTPPQSHRIYANLAGRPGGGWGSGPLDPGDAAAPA